MIASRAEIRESVAAVIRLWRGDISAFGAFDRSVEGFWRSYTAALLAAPVHGLLLFLGAGSATAPIDSVHDVVIEAIGFATVWLAYPLLMLAVTDRLGRSGRFFDYIVPYNWATLAAIVLMTAANLMYTLLPTFVGGVLMLVVLAAIVHLLWFIAREGLQISIGMAILIVLLDFSLTLLVDSLSDYLRL